ncbi:protein kinase [Myxococcota bacterium]|nr:protein kinase [Myxococcota bacterium]
MADVPEDARAPLAGAPAADPERLPTQTIGNPAAASELPPQLTGVGAGASISQATEALPPPDPRADAKAAAVAGSPSLFAGLLAEASAVPSPGPAPRAAHRFTVPSGGDRPAAVPDPRPPVERSTSIGGRTAAPEGRPKLEPPPTASMPFGPAVMPPVTNERRIGPYRVLEELGSGGMAVVYKAVQPSLDRIVAIKELRAEFVHDRQVAARFAREAASLATLQHGNIVTIFDYLYDQESAHIVMEYVEGIDLFDLLAATDRVPSELAAIIGVGVAEALEYAHYRGIIHRDIKPSNILVSKNGEVKLMDFGIARDPQNSELTMVGIAVGTPAYMAPEQIRGDKIDFRTDIFALGIVLYEMIGGEKPWPEEDGRSVTVKVLDEPYKPLSEREPSVPPELERIVERCLQKDPAKRYKTTHELRRDLELYVQSAVSTDPRGRVVLFLRNRGFVTDAQASSFVASALMADVSIRRRDQGIPPPPPRALFEPVGIASAVGLAIIVASGALAAFAPYGQRLPESRPKVALVGGPASPAPAEPAPDERPTAAVVEVTRGLKGRKLTGDEGFVRVVVEPWARVYVDGELWDTTPFADPIALQVVTGKTELVRVSLLPKDDAEGTSDAP